MCGIAAIFAYRDRAPSIDATELSRIAESMRSRGPDGDGAWVAGDGRTGLAHRRLAIIDLSEDGAQPMASADGRIRITYNGEIYNFRTLRAELEAEGRVFRSQSDTEVLLHLYERDGAGMVERLRGMFAFALWDERRRGLLLARDPFGIKPLYIADDGETVRVASQVKALQAGGQTGSTPDPAGHAGFFLFGSVPEPHTLSAGIRALPAGSTQWFDTAGPGPVKRYFDPAAILANSTVGDGPERDLRTLLAESVADHLVADVPVGVFLSTGLDSATIVGLAAEIRGGDPDTMTLAFEEFAGTSRDESPLAERLATDLATRHVTRRVRGAEFRAELDDLLAAMDQPTIDGVNTYFVAREASALGLKVALSGLGGDEMFGGYDTFRQVPALVGALGWVPGLGTVGAGLRAGAAPVLGALAPPKSAGVLELGTRYGDAYLLRRGLFMPWELPGVLGTEMARAGWQALDPLVRLEACHAPVVGGPRKVAALEASWYLKNQLLRDADWAGMAHSLEIRVPFVDPILFRALAPAMGRPGASDKQTMAATPRPPLPENILGRRKTGFSVPVRDWLGVDGQGERGLRGWARRVYAAFA